MSCASSVGRQKDGWRREAGGRRLKWISERARSRGGSVVLVGGICATGISSIASCP